MESITTDNITVAFAFVALELVKMRSATYADLNAIEAAYLQMYGAVRKAYQGKKA